MMLKETLPLVLMLSLSIAVGIAVPGRPSCASELENGIALEVQPGPAQEAPVPIGGLWQEFSFTRVGVLARGCAPADPEGLGCVPSSGGNSEFAGPPPWTFEGPATLILATDAFLYGDAFEVFDFGVSIGTTPLVYTDGSCGDDPVPCSLDPASSTAVFNLGPGTHSITIVPVKSPFGSGAAYFRVDLGPDLVTHYICYKIRDGQIIGEEVEVEDQFGRRIVLIGEEKFFCVPALKNPGQDER